MDAAVHADHGEHAHPTWQTYTKIALVLFALTALEVWLADLRRVMEANYSRLDDLLSDLSEQET